MYRLIKTSGIIKNRQGSPKFNKEASKSIFLQSNRGMVILHTHFGFGNLYFGKRIHQIIAYMHFKE